MNSKKWWESKTIWAGIITTIRGTYLVLQVTLPTFTTIHLPPIPIQIDGILGMFLGGAVVHGRVTADSVISSGTLPQV